MIVKNEAHVIARCLESVRPFISAWVIADTGSTDGTQELVRRVLADLPGELVERPWVDFAHNRNEALELARERADYVLVIDADETLEADEGFVMPRLVEDAYDVELHYGGLAYTRKQIVRAALPWRYVGVLHELLGCPEARPSRLLGGLRIVPRHSGARARDASTYRRDAEILERALVEDPENSRTVFYLAQSYRDAGEPERAVAMYRKRLEMGGWPDEVWWSRYQIARIEEARGRPWSEVLQEYLGAFEYLPDRAEPLYRIGMYHQRRRVHALAHLYFARAVQIPRPGAKRLFVERNVYDFELPIEHAVACHFVGAWSEAIATANRLLASTALPAHLVEHVIRNRRFSLDAMAPRAPSAPVPPVSVVIELGGASATLDDAIGSLLAQHGANFEVLLVGDDAAGATLLPRLPLDDARFHLLPAHEHDAWLAGRPGDEVILRLDASDRLAEPEALALLAAEFADPEVLVAYGQHRRASGALGDAEPAASAADHEARGPRLAGRSPLAVRARLLQTHGASLDDVWRAAGAPRTRFLDAPLTVAGDPPAPRVAPLATIEPGAAGPLVSCLLVTRDRLWLARRAIRSFADQTWRERELIVVCDGAPRVRRALEAYVEEARISRVRFVYPPRDDLPLGALRNLSLDAAAGALVCQWDDDDCSHPERLRLQVEQLLAEGAQASFMTDHLQLLERERTVRWIDWSMGGRLRGTSELAPGTLLMARDPAFRYPEAARQGEDSAMLEALCARVRVARLRGAGHLYLYRFHGHNTFSREHHHRLGVRAAPRSWIAEHERRLRESLRYYEVPRPVFVVGHDGPAFAVA